MASAVTYEMVEAVCNHCSGRFVRRGVSDVRSFCSIQCSAAARSSRFHCEEVTP